MNFTRRMGILSSLRQDWATAGDRYCPAKDAMRTVSVNYAKFGWCKALKHDRCSGTVNHDLKPDSDYEGIHVCACSCHQKVKN